MAARAQYEKELKDLGSEEESDLEVIDETEQMDVVEAVGNQDDIEVKGKSKDKGKGKAVSTASTTTNVSKKRMRPAIDPFAGT